ncbi:MAG TPA: helix-turn-helix transcriptional regulator [Oligoflexia bacterium]|nr:helix-turn-helix transcriptional regulator [Oligoflexia bacterium]HMP27321.1 helix-turn-helix transcriptional regulator [Oligoflexia bacterium]
MKLRKRLAKKLKEIMKERDETQAQFSKRIGVGQATLNRVLNGEQSISIDRLESICNSLRLDIKDLFPEFKKD